MRDTILFLSWMGHLGGAEIALGRLIKHIDQSRFDISVWQFQQGPLEQWLHEMEVPVTVWNFSRFREAVINISIFFHLYRHLKSHRVQLVHAIGTLAYLLGFFPSRLARVPILWGLVDIPEGKSLMERLAVLLSADRIICNSRATADALHKIYPNHTSQCRIVYPPVEEINPMHDQESLRSELDLSITRPVITCIGRLQRWKGQDVLIRAIPSVIKKFPKATFLFVGDALPSMEDGYKEFLENLAVKLSVHSSCRFLGFRKDIPDLIKLSDLIVHTSVKPEPFGLVIAETMIQGKPVIATDQGGPREIIEHGVDGWLVSEGNPDILSDAIVHLLMDAKLCQKLGARGREKVLAKFGASKIARATESIYSELKRHE